ncbi:hypothetical protein Tco_0159228 [Tanacetum coccineum]
MAPMTRRGPNTPTNNTNPNNMTPESIQAMIDQALQRNPTNGEGSHSSHGDNRRNVQTARPCYYANFMKCQPLNFKGTEGVVGLIRWIEKMEAVFNISSYAIENQEFISRINNEDTMDVHCDNHCNTPKSGSQRNVEYPRALHYGSIAQDMRTNTKRVV